MKKHISKILTQSLPFIKFVLFIFVVLFIIYFIKNHESEFRQITNVKWVTLFWLSMLFILIQFLYSYQYGLLLKNFGINLKISTLFKLVSLRAYYNYLPLNAGTVHNAVFLKNRTNMPITSFVSLITGSAILMIFAYGIIGIFIMIYHYLKEGSFSLAFFILLIIIVISGILLLIIPVPKIKSDKRIFIWLSNIQSGLNIIKKNKCELIKIILLHILVLLIFSLRYWLIFHDVNVPVNLAEIIIITIITSVMRLNSIIPGNLGVRESITGYVVSSFGYTFTTGVMIGIVDRIILMFWTLIFGLIFSLPNKKLVKNN